MKKILSIILVLTFMLSFGLILTSCNNSLMGEKEVAVQIQKTMTAHKVEGNEEVVVAFVQFGFNVNKIYVELPALEVGQTMPSTIIIKKTNNTIKYIILNDKNKAQTVNNHGFEFLKWGN